MAVDDPTPGVVLDLELPVDTDGWMKCIMRVVSPHRSTRNIGTFQTSCIWQSAGGNFLMHRVYRVQYLFSELLCRHDQEINVAGFRVKIAQGERTVQVESDQTVVQDDLHSCEQSEKQGIDIGVWCGVLRWRHGNGPPALTVIVSIVIYFDAFL